ncbi:MAG: hypothetical protein SH820_06685 [Xanthomonadales bacterium]|nr:hypothetical protein [Xanthomonadales bacterium]
MHASECLKTSNPAYPDYELLTPHYFDMMSIDSKLITGPARPSRTWSYAYVPNIQNLWGLPTQSPTYPCTTCTPEKTTTLTNPDNTVVVK